MSLFMRGRQQYQPKVPDVLAQKNTADLSVLRSGSFEPEVDAAERDTLRTLFPSTWGQPLLELGATVAGRGGDSGGLTAAPIRVGIVLSGGQAPGGHNVVCGIYEALRDLAPGSEVIGFLRGPSGILDDKTMIIDEKIIGAYRNSGGFDMLGSGRTKIETEEQLARCAEVLKRQAMNALIVVGGDDSNTNAAVLAEYLRARGETCAVVGVPKTIDGDLRNKFVEASFGFDTAVKLYSELIANIARDAASARKYYHFIRLMGRAASHITLEAAIQTHPNVVLISEEIAAARKTLAEITDDIVQVVLTRAKVGKHYGVVLVPEGLIEFVPEMRDLIAELNKLLAEQASEFLVLNSDQTKIAYVAKLLSPAASVTMATLPSEIQAQLLFDRDPHGNVQVSRIETEKLLIGLVSARLEALRLSGEYRDLFGSQSHFFGYEGRCAAPTNFDADYAYALGRTAAILGMLRANGYMSVVGNLETDRAHWRAMGVPLVSMLTLEERKGKIRPVIRKALVDLKGRAFQHLCAERQKWAEGDMYRFVGAIQYFGPPELCDQIPAYLRLNQGLDISYE